MKIYTKTGDKGKTSLFGNARVDKDDIRIEAYGTVDELNSHIGLLLEHIDNQEDKALLLGIQSKLFDVGSNLAADPEFDYPLPKIEATDSSKLELAIDKMNESLTPLKTFILPGGSRSNAVAHLCRTVCRRAERRVVSLSKVAEVHPEIIIYLNRLSDYFFVLSRYLLHLEGKEEIPWMASK
jgi:cob(I)alamin adenosyltransferase